MHSFDSPVFIAEIPTPSAFWYNLTQHEWRDFFWLELYMFYKRPSAQISIWDQAVKQPMLSAGLFNWYPDRVQRRKLFFFLESCNGLRTGERKNHVRSSLLINKHSINLNPKSLKYKYSTLSFLHFCSLFIFHESDASYLLFKK